MRRAGFSLPLAPSALVAAGLAANAVLLYAVTQRDVAQAIVLSFVPLALVVFGALVARDRSILVFGALGLSFTVGYTNAPIPSLGGVFPADVLVVLALASWLGEFLLGEGGRRVSLPRSPLVGWPLVLLAVALLVAFLRGYASYDTPLFGQSLRLVFYPLIALALVGSDSQKIYRGVVAVFYIGTVWMFFNAVYYLATGTSQTGSSHLSTGGFRVLSLTVSLYLAGALFLALLNLEIDRSAKRRALHLAIAGLALFGVIVAYGRGTFVAVAVVVPLILLVAARARAAVLGLVPLCVPFVLLAVIFVPRFVPEIDTTFRARVSLSGTNDASVRVREETNSLFWNQVESSPLVGVGFGKTELLTFLNQTVKVDQGGHNSWLYLLAGGGAVTVGAFALFLAIYLRDLWQRARGAASGYERVLLAWCALMLFTLLLNAISQPLFSYPSLILTIWMLLFLPAVVPLRERERVEATVNLPPWSRPSRLDRLRTSTSRGVSSSAH